MFIEKLPKDRQSLLLENKKKFVSKNKIYMFVHIQIVETKLTNTNTLCVSTLLLPSKQDAFLFSYF